MNSSASSLPRALATNMIPPRRILLVEDNEMGRQIVRIMLEHLQLQVVEAVDGAEALAKVTAENFDLVLMDIQMPVMDGIAAAKAIHMLAQPKASIPIIAMTAYMETEIEQQFTQAGFNSCISKPIELDTLGLQLQRWLPNLPIPLTIENISLDNRTVLQQALPRVDITAALGRCGGNSQLYRNLLKKFNIQFSNSASQLQQEIVTQKYQSARFIVHNLKGTAATLGAVDLQRCADDLEHQLANEQQPDALNATLVELHRFLNLIKALPVEDDLVNKEGAGEQQCGNCAELRSILLALRTPLAKLQIKHLKQPRAQLAQKQWPEFLTAQVQQLVEQMDSYQFSPASELVEDILSTSSEPASYGTENN